MRLSEYITLGSRLSKQAFGVERLPDGSTCAMGAALDAGFGDDDSYYDRVLVSCSLCHWGGVTGVVGLILHLNDGHRWSREQIARWLTRLEDWMELDMIYAQLPPVGALPPAIEKELELCSR